MRKVWSWGCLAATVLVSGCNSPHLAISAELATVPAGSSMAFQALAQDSDGQITWTLSGPGSLDLTTGPQITYSAPPTYDPAGQHTAIITVQLSDAADETKKIGITITKPSTSTGGIPGLNTNVTVTYDERDIPTITCIKSVDCYAVLGYIHARDRFFQMDFYRRAARGNLFIPAPLFDVPVLVDVGCRPGLILIDDATHQRQCEQRRAGQCGDHVQGRDRPGISR